MGEIQKMRGIRGKVALITGAGRGIGKAVALRLAEEGANLVLNDLDEEPLSEVARDIQRSGVEIVAGSVTEPETVGHMVNRAVETFGDLNIVITCAGFTWDGLLHKMNDEQWQTILDVHLTGTFKVIREAVVFMRSKAKEEHNDGCIVIPRKVVTVSSSSAFGNFGQSNYAAAKAGIIGLTKTLAIEGAAFNITANSVAFGLMDTRLTQDKAIGEMFMGKIPLGIPNDIREDSVKRVLLKRPGKVEEAAGTISFLASEDANYITGHVLEVNGGFHM